MTIGNCSCKAVKLTLSLPSELHTYAPRACDCDFCTKRHITYLSDPEGRLVIHSENTLQSLQHGSKQAIFVSCNHCHDVVAVICKFDNIYKGAVNAAILEDFRKMKAPQVVSPKLLSAIEKYKRWNRLWLTVELDFAFTLQAERELDSSTNCDS